MSSSRLMVLFVPMIPTIRFQYMYVCILMVCVGLSAPVTCNALSEACFDQEIKVLIW